MTNSTAFSHLRRAAAIAVAFTLSLAAAPKVPKTWSELASYLRGKYVTITMKNGHSTKGLFVESRPDALVLAGGKEVPRTMVVGVRLDGDPSIEKSKLDQLGGILRTGYSHTLKNLFGPMAPIGIVEVPAVTAYAIVAAPFCALGDLFSDRHKAPPIDIELVADTK
jgi:hypothetical protein